jgi:mannose-1-phosphate guanylyltransferase
MSLNDEAVQVANPLVVTGEDHRFLAIEQLREIGVAPSAALLEPVARNTAPALTLAALAAATVVRPCKISKTSCVLRLAVQRLNSSSIVTLISSPCRNIN